MKSVSELVVLLLDKEITFQGITYKVSLTDVVADMMLKARNEEERKKILESAIGVGCIQVRVRQERSVWRYYSTIRDDVSSKLFLRTLERLIR